MSRNHQFKNDYMNFMKELISKGCATESTAAAENGKCWYLTHHGVYNPNKPGKICIVFDVRAEFQGTSISKSLLPGPDLANQIVGVVLRFREEPMAVTDDIEAKYHQVNIPVEQRASYNFFGGRTVILKMKLKTTKWQHMYLVVYPLHHAPITHQRKLQPTILTSMEMKPEQFLREISLEMTCSRAFQIRN